MGIMDVGFYNIDGSTHKRGRQKMTTHSTLVFLRFRDWVQSVAGARDVAKNVSIELTVIAGELHLYRMPRQAKELGPECGRSQKSGRKKCP